jgi:hypothetical protein
VSSRLEDEVGVAVHDAVEPEPRPHAAGRALLSLAADAVLLHPEGVDGEHQRAAPVVERVQQDLHLVVGVDGVPVGEGGADLPAVRLEGPDAEPDRVRRVPDAHLGRVLGGAAVHGAVLGEAGQQRRVAPHRLRERAVHRRVGLDAGRAHVELAGAAVVDGAAALGL